MSRTGIVIKIVWMIGETCFLCHKCVCIKGVFYHKLLSIAWGLVYREKVNFFMLAGIHVIVSMDTDTIKTVFFGTVPLFVIW